MMGCATNCEMFLSSAGAVDGLKPSWTSDVIIGAPLTAGTAGWVPGGGAIGADATGVAGAAGAGAEVSAGAGGALSVGAVAEAGGGGSAAAGCGGVASATVVVSAGPGGAAAGARSAASESEASRCSSGVVVPVGLSGMAARSGVAGALASAAGGGGAAGNPCWSAGAAAGVSSPITSL